MNPYSEIPDYCFWSRAVSRLPIGAIDPVTQDNIIFPEDNVATIGSCFAQHIAQHLKKCGLKYMLTENPPQNLTANEAVKSGYGMFTARFGNVYTVRQASQLFDRAYGELQPCDIFWRKGDSLVDPFRPLIEPDGFKDIESLLESRYVHFSAVRNMFEGANWLIFTLGLTESWVSKVDGSIFPLAPGISGGEYDANRYDFINFDIQETIDDLNKLIIKIRNLNKNIKIMLTVSPVPLIATYENRHVLVSTCISKSILRVAADMAVKTFDNVFYFPSYEIVTSSATSGFYYADDLRQVKEVGVKHVMRIFEKHHIKSSQRARIQGQNLNLSNQDLNSCESITCDEEVIETALRLSGF